MSTSSSSHSTSAVAVTAAVTGLVAVTATALVTHYVTKRTEMNKHQQRQYESYQRNKMIREKTMQIRKEAGEPASGELIDVRIDQVYLWEVEDLKKRFPGTKLENKMRVSDAPLRTRSPMLRKVSDGTNDTADGDDGTPAAGKRGSFSTGKGFQITDYNKLITNHECILGKIIRKPNMAVHSVAYVRAGPRRHLHFDPRQVNAAIVTCGGLCPGLNNCIREITKTLHQLYGIGGKVYGIQAGYHGFSATEPHMQPLELTPELVEDIHHSGGTVLGSSRGGFDLEAILAFLKKYDVNQLYVIGGDGTHRGAFRIHEGCMEHGLNVAVAGIPKTIDNDIDHIDHTFGFASAVEAAQVAIRSAKTEAVCNLPNGIGIVKLMGRSAGFIAAHATMASGDVDLCLVPEVPLVLEGKDGCLPHLWRRVKQQGYAVVVVAEGAGEELLGTSAETDASGNKKLPKIGEFMKKEVEGYFKKKGEVATVKYIDPSYIVRSVPANAADSLYCMQLGQNAVHGAMAGFTGFSVGLCNNRMVFLPIPQLVATSPRNMNPKGRTWERVLALTRQPNTVPEDEEEYEHTEATLR
ncbi:phosphofructokinase 5, chloroplastic [Seminavis robusta]|uniref:Phosphofructokinase 5, chloroplastic n=1 Tax=Seminavis robusta TaxID=568900 RepID=A0A9N8HLE6_9STRA|nr:phosphofructokinase 5, chloroplastic [Seminavis robusta]|eukprot:Sro909_g219010.1 phosphofructokinase 5, chloroplastic (579) ;mRNA; f:27066-29208